MEVLQTSALPLGDGADRLFWRDAGRPTHPREALRDAGSPAKENGAGNGIRTRDFDLGKVALYH